MLLTGTATDLLDFPVQNLITMAMRKAELEEGIGYLTPEDVRAHLQEAVLAAAHRYQPDRGVKLTTFLWHRAHGAAVQLVRSYGMTTRAGNPRAVVVSLEAQRRTKDEEISERLPANLDTVAVDDELLESKEDGADLVLAVGRLPRRMRLVLYGLFYEELDVDLLARRLRCSAECVRDLRDAALKKVRLSLLRSP